MHINTVRLL